MSDDGQPTKTKPIVIDNGTATIKAGFSGEDAPRVVFPTVVSRQARPGGRGFVGDDAVRLQRDLRRVDITRGFAPAAAVTTTGSNNNNTVNEPALTFKRPIEHGIVTNWDDMELIWHHTFYNELRVDPSDYVVMLSEPPLNPKANREKTTQIMFETFDVAGMYLASTSNLALYSSGRTHGVVLDVGAQSANACPIYEGYGLPHSFERADYGGEHLTKHLQNLLKSHTAGAPGEPTLTAEQLADLDFINEIKEKACFVAAGSKQQGGEGEATTTSPPSAASAVPCGEFYLPDDSVVKLGTAASACPEALFNPSIMGPGIISNAAATKGVAQLTLAALQKNEPDIIGDLFNNTLVVGGSTLFDGFATRLRDEIKGMLIGNNFTTHASKVNVLAPPNRRVATFDGASTLAGLPSFETMWFSKSEYEDNGPNLVHQKCIS